MASKRPDSRQFQVESLETRTLLSAVPFGASAEDTAEFMIGDVAVSVVLMESDGTIDPNTENWTDSQIQQVKHNVREGLDWWSDMLERENSVHSLNFKIDNTFADNPVKTRYEPISRKSDDVSYWIEDFFSHVGINSRGSFSRRIRDFNHQQRLKHDTNWAFTIFVVNADNDRDGRFDTDGAFSLAYAYAGGRFMVITGDRPPASVAHETAHMFWGMDEYSDSSATFNDRRGYYNTQNTNAVNGHPNPSSRERSIMEEQSIGFSRHALSTSVKETIGWKDSDGDGIFDVLDVPLKISGTGHFNQTSNVAQFVGSASTSVLPNKNPSGSGNDMTINRVSRLEFRIDDGPWKIARFYDKYEVDFDVSIPVGPDAKSVELRAIDASSGVTSVALRTSIARPAVKTWRNDSFPTDVNGDSHLSPIDALQVINDLNVNGSRRLPTTGTGGPPYVDVNGDSYVSPTDALRVINALNQIGQAATPVESNELPNYSQIPPRAEGEPDPAKFDAERIDLTIDRDDHPKQLNHFADSNVSVLDSLFDHGEQRRQPHKKLVDVMAALEARMVDDLFDQNSSNAAF
ncbi:MAG: hypothetical protein KDB27_09655 [Planctomycetales bacterium]|nr:hypothetical protein [Planctomycetales bacterium]